MKNFTWGLVAGIFMFCLYNNPSLIGTAWNGAKKATVFTVKTTGSFLHYALAPKIDNQPRYQEVIVSNPKPRYIPASAPQVQARPVQQEVEVAPKEEVAVTTEAKLPVNHTAVVKKPRSRTYNQVVQQQIPKTSISIVNQ